MPQAEGGVTPERGSAGSERPLGPEYAEVFRPRAQRLLRLPRVLAKAIRLVWAAGRRELLVTTLLQLFQGVGVGVQLLLGKRVLEAMLDSRTAGAFSRVLPELGLLVAITVLLSFVTAVLVEQSRVLGELVGRTAFDRVLDVATTVELEAFESPTFFDRLRRAQLAGLTRPLQMVNGLGTLTTSVITLLGIGVALIAIQPILLPFIVLGYAPLWFASTRNSKALYRFVLDLTEDDRQRGYLQQVLAGRDEAKEVRAFGLAPLLRRRYDRLYDERIAKLRHLARRRLARSLSAAVGTSGLTVASLGLLGYLYVEGRMSLAALGAAVAGLLQVSGRLAGVAAGAGALYESALFIDDYQAFVDVAAGPPRANEGGDPLPPFNHLLADELTFTYPGSAEPAIAGVTIEVRRGEVVALVGENGSGKTTLAKLLAHLYVPGAGRILWDRRDTRSFEPAQVRRSIAVIFQDFVRYRLPARENIGAGRHEHFDDIEGIVAAARTAGADSFLSQLPEGYDTTLSKEFRGGTDLSVGQWQRVALARAFFRDAPFVILDEPTAALDPRAEYELFSSIRSLFQGRSVLLISHRFSSVRNADRIYVLKDGAVVEEGDHDTLMAGAGIYAELFTLQASAYLRTSGDQEEPGPAGPTGPSAAQDPGPAT
jgi:ATP-binding cassette subfamily B protein